jgi:hypothetical protein
MLLLKFAILGRSEKLVVENGIEIKNFRKKEKLC